jgi:hypothetical protein
LIQIQKKGAGKTNGILVLVFRNSVLTALHSARSHTTVGTTAGHKICVDLLGEEKPHQEVGVLFGGPAARCQELIMRLPQLHCPKALWFYWHERHEIGKHHGLHQYLGLHRTLFSQKFESKQ